MTGSFLGYANVTETVQHLTVAHWRRSFHFIYHMVHFAGPTPGECNPCTGWWSAGGIPALAVDSNSGLIEIQFLPWLDGEYVCVADCPGVCVLEGEFGYLSEGDWHFFCADSYAPFSIDFAVVAPETLPLSARLLLDNIEDAIARWLAELGIAVPPDDMDGNGVPDFLETPMDVFREWIPRELVDAEGNVIPHLGVPLPAGLAETLEEWLVEQGITVPASSVSELVDDLEDEIGAWLAFFDHVSSISGDTDADFLTDSEEDAIGYDVSDPDEDSNGIADGVDLALEMYEQIWRLDWYWEAWEGGPDGSDPPDITGLPTDRLYAIRFDYMVDCLWTCAVCQEGITIGHLQIVNPNLHANWQEGLAIPLDACHYMEHGSFSYSSACGGPHEGRVDVAALLQVLGRWEVVRVDRDNVSGPWDGTSWATAFATIQEGVDAAYAGGGGEVWVAEGVYDEERANDTGSVIMRENVHVFGGFAGTETDRSQRDWETYVTVIDGSAARDGLPAYHVVVGADYATLDGFIVTGGQASGTDYEACGGGMLLLYYYASSTVNNCAFAENSADHGGGIYAGLSAITVTDCTFTGNTAELEGGGLWIAGGCAVGPTVTGCTFAGNTTHGEGGGVFSRGWPAMSNCTFVGNAARNGGGVHAWNMYDWNCSFWGFMENCTFSGNMADEDGGGLYLNSPFSLIPETVNLAPTDCTFSENMADRGGGMYAAVEFGAWWPDVANCSFQGNSARVGGGMFNEGFGGFEPHDGEPWYGYSVTNCVFADNSAQDAGAGMYNLRLSPPITNCTFSGNGATNIGGAIANAESASPVLLNCILWNDLPEEIVNLDETCEPLATFSDIKGGYPGDGNIDLEPLFVDPASADFRLQAASPCIDAGTSEGAPESDIMAIPRPQGAEVDMGAYEFTDADSDGDTILDTYEGGQDPDRDGIPNYLDSDSDDDGFTDGDEVAHGTDPYDPDSIPTFTRGGSCFIATAAYGTPAAPEVERLREFRDRYLLTNRAGAAFVRAYYRFSPHAARFIAAREPLRTAVRALLRPVVVIAKLTPGSGAVLAAAVAMGLVILAATRSARRNGRARGHWSTPRCVFPVLLFAAAVIGLPMQAVIADEGDLVWATSAGGADHDLPYAIAALSNGSALVTGYFQDTAVFGGGEPNQTALHAAGSFDIFVAKYNPEGTLAWAVSAGVSDREDGGPGIAAASDGGALVTGSFRDTVTFGLGEPNQTTLISAGGPDIFVAKYNPDGVLAWAVSAGGGPDYYCGEGDFGARIAAVSDGGAVVTGYFSNTVTFGLGEPNETTLSAAGWSDIFVARYNPDGTLAWVVSAGASGANYGRGIAAVSDGGALVTGEINGPPADCVTINQERLAANGTTPTMLVARYDPDGTLVWARETGGTASGIAALLDGGAVVTGSFWDTVTFGLGEPNETTLSAAGWGDLFVAKHNPDGTLAWAVSAGGFAEDRGQGIAALQNGSALVTGSFHDTAVFGLGEPNERTLTSAGESDIFVAKYTPDGALAWAVSAGGFHRNCGTGIAAVSDGSALVTGYFEREATLGPGEPNETALISAGGHDIFVAKFEGGPDSAYGRWTAFGLDDKFVYSLAQTEDTLLAGTSEGVFMKDLDADTDWISLGLEEQHVGHIVVNPLIPNIMYATDISVPRVIPPTDQVSLYKSTDGGGTWFPSDTGIRGYFIWDVKASPDDPSTLFCVVCEGAILRSEDGGESWQLVLGESFDYMLGTTVLAIDPNNPSPRATSVARLMGNLDSRYDVGDTVQRLIRVYDSLGTVHEVTVTFTRIAGVRTWTWDATHPTAGASGSGTITFDTDGQVPPGGIVGDTVSISPPGTSATDPLVFTLDMSGLTQWSAPVTVALTNQDGLPPGTFESCIWAGGTGPIENFVLLKSIDTGDNWERLFPYDFGACTAIAVSRQDSNVVYIGVGEGVSKTTDGGEHFAQCSAEGAQGWVTCIAINPLNQDHVYVGAFAINYEEPDPNPIFGPGRFTMSETKDGGESPWTAIGNELYESGANGVYALIVDEGDPGVLYVGTGGTGVFKYTSNDTDGDLLPDSVETNTGSFIDETDAGTDHSNPDTDGDGLRDGDEVYTHLTDPNDADTDEDLLSDGEEVNTHLTNPLDADTDGDGLRDGDEVMQGSDPLDPASGYVRGGSCFIASAAYGTPAAREVRVLREFRDRYLLTNRAGAAFVRAYYRFSPPVARFIAAREPLRAAVRVCLVPVVAVVNSAEIVPQLVVLVALIAVALHIFLLASRARAIGYAPELSEGGGYGIVRGNLSRQKGFPPDPLPKTYEQH